MASTSRGSGPPSFDPNDRTLPAWMDGEGDHGVVIILQMRTTMEGKPLPKNPFTVAKTVQQNAGKIASAHNENRGMSMVLKVRSEKQAQQLKKINKLVDGTEVVVIDHPTLNQTRCVVSCSQSIGMTEAELVEELKEQGVTGVRKFTRMVNGTRTETASMVLTIQGTVKPEFIFFGFQRCDARLYIPSPMLCFNCYEFGHSKAKCGNAPVCRHCSTTHEQQTDAEGRHSCQKPAFCKNCQGKHGPGSKECPKYKEEAEIARLRTEQKISFAEAKQKIAATSSKTSFSSTVTQNLVQIDPRARAQESETIMALKRELADTKKALGEVGDARAVMKELAEARKALAELAEARKAVLEVEKLRQEIVELKAQQLNANPSDNDSTEQLTKAQKKALKKQQRTTLKDNEETLPEPKKPKQSNPPKDDEVNKTAQYYKLNKTTLLDDPINLRRSRNDSQSNCTERSVSRSPI